MSRARNNLRKVKQQAVDEVALANGSLTPDDINYRKEVRRKIRNEVYAGRFFVKGAGDKLERDAKGRLTWSTRSTFAELTKK